MTVLDFARGPGLQWSLVIFVIGVLWRLVGIFFLKHTRDLNEPRNGGVAPWLGGLKVVFTRMWPRKEFRARTAYSETLSYIFHFGLAIVVFFGAFHITFIKSLFGVSWGNLPNSVIYFTAVITLATMVALLIRRLTHPVLKVLSNFDDYFSWAVVAAPLVTGLMATAHLGGPYETLLGVHILSFEVLLVWFPFGKLMHAFLVAPSRAAAGYVFTRKGAST